jgi:hypothetical protein
MVRQFGLSGVCDHDEVDWLPMDPRDRLQPFANGVDCAVCGGLVPIDRIRILARRDDLAFLELTCTACRSESLGIVVADGAATNRSTLSYGEFEAADEARFRDAPAIDSDDLAVARELLRLGGIDALVGRAGHGPDRGAA